MKISDTIRPITPATAAARNPHCQPARATIQPVIIIETALPSWGVELKMPYMVPRVFRGNQRDREIVPGGDPIDCIQPLMPQSVEKRPSISSEPKPSGPCSRPKTPRSRFTAAETPIPAAMKRRMLQ